jgi:hypothetical protein
MDDNGFSLEDRLLCSDGACIGLVGQDGLCKACGKAYEGDESLPAAKQDQPTAPEADLEPLPVDDAPPALFNGGADDGEDPDPLEPTDRIPCPDDMCVGVIGADGQCGICGRSQ